MPNSVPFPEQISQPIIPDAGFQKGTADSFTELDLEINPPLELYESVKGLPYGAEFFELEDYNLIANEPLLDIDGLKNKMDSINEYVNEMLEANGMKHEPSSYKEIIKMVLNIIGEIPNEIGSHKMQRVFDWIQMRNKIKQEEQKKQQIIEKLTINKYDEQQNETKEKNDNDDGTHAG